MLKVFYRKATNCVLCGGLDVCVMEDPIAQAGCVMQSSRILMEDAQRIFLSWQSAPMGRLLQSLCVQG